MVEFVQSYLIKQNDQYKRDKDYINTMYDKAEHMDGTVVKLQGGTEWNNYESNIGDPVKQSTLVIRGQDQNIYYSRCPLHAGQLASTMEWTS